MGDLKTTYMGVPLENPVVVAACSLSGMLDNIKRVEAAGAGGMVIKSLFEEQILWESMKLEEEESVGSESFGESIRYFPPLKHAGPKQHLMWVEKACNAVKMPLFASLNAINPGNWVSYARMLQETGVKGVELNVYAVQTALERTAAEVEKSLYEIVEQVKAQVTIPVAVKLSPFYTSVANVAAELDKRGANALVLFNRFIQPDVDVNTELLRTEMKYSQPCAMRLPLRWVALLHGRVRADLAATSGVHDSESVVKVLLAGATVAQVASTLYMHGIEYVSAILDGIRKWMSARGYKAVGEFRGKLSQKSVADPYLFERAQYVKALMGAP